MAVPYRVREIALVIGRPLPVGTQFIESKSYPTFTPVGRALVLINADELKRFGDLRLQLRVNGQTRQNMFVAGDMLYPPLTACRR